MINPTKAIAGYILIVILAAWFSMGQGLAQGAKRLVTLEASTDYAHWAKFSSDRKFIAAKCSSSVVRIWDVATGKVKAEFQEERVPRDTEPAFSRDGRLLATATEGAFEGVQLWDLTKAKEKYRLEGEAEIILALAFSPDSKQLATAAVGAFGGVQLRDLAKAKEKQRLDGQAEMVLGLAFSPDSKKLATANSNDTLTIWDVASAREKTLDGHDSTVFAVAFSRDGKLLASGSRDRTVKIWDVASGAEKVCLKWHLGAVTSVAFSSDGKFLVSSSVFLNIDKEIRSGRRDDRLLVSAERDLTVKTWNEPTVSYDMTVIIWDLQTGKQRALFKGCGRSVLSDDDKLLATLTEDGKTLQVWDTVTAKEKFSHKFPASITVLALTFCGDGNLLGVAKDKSGLKLCPISMSQKTHK